MLSSRPSWLKKFNAHQRLLISLGVACVCFFLLPQDFSLPLRLISMWDIAVSFFLLLAWLLIIGATAEETDCYTDTQDQSGGIILVVGIVAACVSLFAIGALIGNSKHAPGLQIAVYASLSAIAVACSWLIIHTLFAFHYAHCYYRNTDESESRTNQQGLLFPDEKKPDYLDFAYFSFVIGMTSQVSDVQITSRRMRHLVLIHGLMSFAFNVVIVAITINIIAGVI